MKSARAKHRSLLQTCLYRALFALAFLAPACHLGQDSKSEERLSFSQHFDNLSQYDSLVIEVKDPDGRLLAVIFKEKAVTRDQLDDLDVPGWDGGPIVIVLTGYRNGQAAPVYQEEKHYNGDTRRTDQIVIHIHPNPTLSTSASIAPMQVGQRSPLPLVDVHPANLANPGLTWTSDNAGVAAVEGAELVAISPGSARITVKLARDTAKLIFTVQVSSDPQVPNRLLLDRDTLRLARNGAPRRFGIEAQPAAASTEVTWRLSDSTVAALLADGSFLGLAEGVTRAWAVSKFDPSVRDSGWIAVGESVSVASVRFIRDTLDLFMGGAPESLAVEVLPDQANAEVLFSLSDSSKAVLSGKLLSAKAVGDFTVVVRSRENTTLSDILTVRVREPVRVDRVEALAPAVTLYLGAPLQVLTAKVYPDSMPQGVHWKSLSPTIVSAHQLTGEIAPIKAGLALVVVISQADTSARDTVSVTVKADAPRLAAGADTLVSAGATVFFRVVSTQEYGQVTMFQWDLDGNQAWDDSLPGPWTGTSVELPAVSKKYDQAGTVTARFRARDTEGNLSIVATRIVRVVGGAAVSIDSPQDNSYTNQRRITVGWSVNGAPQDSLTSENLTVMGPNLITRSARDSSGMIRTATITVHLDTIAPLAPRLSGTSPTNTKPRWTWSTGGGGSGDFRFRLGDRIFPVDAPTTRDSVHILAAEPVSGTTYTLYLQERDLAGNWSPADSLAIRYDVSKPVVAITSPKSSGIHYTSIASVPLSGTASGPLPIVRTSYRIGTATPADASFSAGAWTTPAIALQEGSVAVVTVTAVDNAGNSGDAVLSLFLDATPPTAPVISTGPPATTTSLKGTFSWTAGGDGATGSGLNGRYRYNLNGGAWKDTSAALLTDLPLIEGNNIFSVQEQDRALLWSPSATRSVRVDTTGPVITLASHANPASIQTLAVTLSGQVRDTGTAVATMTVSGQAAGSGTIAVTGVTWTSASLTLAAGSNSLLITATDLLGNVRRLTAVLNVNLPAPVVRITTPGDSLTITRLDTIRVSYTIDDVAGNRLFNLVEGVNRLVVASLANASGNIGRDTVKVTRDATQPLSPTLTPGPSPTNGSATWTWVGRGDNTGGSGVRNPRLFRYSLNNGAFVETTAIPYQFQVATEGTYTLVVQEQDRAGNWSLSSTAHTIVVDKTPPRVKITYPDTTYPQYVTNKPSVTVRYRVDNGQEQPLVCALNVNQDVPKLCIASFSDAANNQGADTMIVWSRPGVKFCTPLGAGSRDGSDWENAMSDAQLDISLETFETGNKVFWVSTGEFLSDKSNNNSATILAGFNAASRPYNANTRSKDGTRFGRIFHSAFNLPFHLDGGLVPNIGAYGATVTLTDVKIVSLPGQIENNGLFFPDPAAIVTVNNITIENQVFESNPVYLGPGTFTFNGGSIRNNSVTGGSISPSEAIQVQGTVRLNYPMVLQGGLYLAARVWSGGTLRVQTRVDVICSEDVVTEPDGSCSTVP